MAELALMTPETTEEKRTRRTVDQELRLIDQIMALLEDEMARTQQRVLSYLNDRFDINRRPQP